MNEDDLGNGKYSMVNDSMVFRIVSFYYTHIMSGQQAYRNRKIKLYSHRYTLTLIYKVFNLDLFINARILTSLKVENLSTCVPVYYTFFSRLL